MFGKKAETLREKLAFSASKKCFLLIYTIWSGKAEGLLTNASYLFTQTGQGKQKVEAAHASPNQTAQYKLTRFSRYKNKTRRALVIYIQGRDLNS